MPLRIKTNSTAATATRALAASDAQMSKALERLSTGLRINRAADDAAGLSVAEQLHSQVGGLTTAGRNVQDAINVVQVADGALSQTGAILQRMRDLAVQAMNGGAQDANADAAAQAEFLQLQDGLDRIAELTRFGSQRLLSVGMSGGTAYQGVFQAGASAAPSDQITVDLSAAVFGAPVTGWRAIWAQASDSYVLKDYSTTPGQLTVSDGAATASISLTADYTGRTPADVAADIQAQLTAQGVTTFVATVDQSNHLNFQEQRNGSVQFAVTASGGAAGFTTGAANVKGGYPSPTGFSSGGLDLWATGSNPATVDTAAHAADAVGRIDNALQYLSVARAKLGAYQNRFEHAATVIDVSVENLSASESMIRDADMADEMTQLTRSRILAEAGTSMLAQANQSPQTLLQLLRS